MKAAIILPVHDEADIFEISLARILPWARERFGQGGFEIILSENASTDDTRERAAKICRTEPGLRLLASDEPGKGGAIKRAAAAVDADVYMIMDIDLSTELGSAERLIRAVGSGADLAIGSRRMPDSVVERPLLRRAVTWIYAKVAFAALRIGIRDWQCGCKAFNRIVRDRILPKVKDNGFFFDTELIARSHRDGLRIEEIGVHWNEIMHPDRRSQVRIVPTAWQFLKKLAALRRELR